MKKAFTLIELLLVLAILGIVYSIAIPTYDKYVLKTHFDEAKVILQKLMLAQERYMAKHGEYYTPESGSIDNELMIATNLGVDLSTSHNFTYQVLSANEHNDIPQVKLKGILRPATVEANCNSQLDNPDYSCKQNGTEEEEDWVKKRNPLFTNSEDGKYYYIEVRYPSLYSDKENGIDYSHYYGD